MYNMNPYSSIMCMPCVPVKMGLITISTAVSKACVITQTARVYIICCNEPIDDKPIHLPRDNSAPVLETRYYH